MSQNPYRVLFVCMGNICRSPAAEGVFRHLVSQSGLSEQIEIDSAGTIGFHANSPADSRMQTSANKRGYQLDSRSRRVGPDDFDAFDLVLAMDKENLRDMTPFCAGDSRAKLQLFGEFCQRSKRLEVPDPYYGDGDGFEVVLDMIEDGCEHLLAHIEKTIGQNPSA